MIDGAKVADDIITCRTNSRAYVLTVDSTAALASYINHLREIAISAKQTNQAYQLLLKTHQPAVTNQLDDYVSKAEQALDELRAYIKTLGG